MSRVMAFGTFDNLHPGHLAYFSQARSLGQELVVVVARDKNVLKQKGKEALEDEKQRLRKAKEAILALHISGRAVLGGLRDKYSVLRRFRPSVIALGYDQSANLEELDNEIRRLNLNCRIVRLQPYRADKYKSSYYRARKS